MPTEHLTVRPALPRRMLGVVLGALLVAGVLQVDSLHARAERLPPTEDAGTWDRRAIALAVTTPLATAASTLGLDRPRARLAGLVSSDDQVQPRGRPNAADLEDVHRKPAPQAEAGLPSPTPPSPDKEGGDRPPGVASASAPGGGGAPLRNPTSERPLRVLFVGDSLMESAQPLVGTYLRGPGLVRTIRAWKYSTSLVAPSFYDWPAELPGLLRQHAPDLVVVMIGGNDGQGMMVGRNVLPLGSEAWSKEWRTRAGRMAQALAAAHVPAWWLTLPSMRAPNVERSRRAINALLPTLTGPWLQVMDTRPIFDGPGGAYAEVRPDPRRPGRPVSLRSGDGVHLNVAGSEILARAIVATLARATNHVDDWAPLAAGVPPLPVVVAGTPGASPSAQTGP